MRYYDGVSLNLQSNKISSLQLKVNIWRQMSLIDITAAQLCDQSHWLRISSKYRKVGYVICVLCLFCWCVQDNFWFYVNRVSKATRVSVVRMTSRQFRNGNSRFCVDYCPPLSRKRGDIKSHSSVCLSVRPSVPPSVRLSVTKTLTWLISSEVLKIEHWYLACMILVTSPFKWCRPVTLTFDLLQGQSCCRAGDHNSPNLLVIIGIPNKLIK